MWGAIIQALLGGYSMYEQYAAQQDAKRARHVQRHQDAWDQLLSAAGGYNPGRQAPVEATPKTNIGATGLAMYNAYDQAQNQNDQQQWSRQEAERQQAEVERRNKAQEELQRMQIDRKPLKLAGPSGKRNEMADIVAAAVSGKSPDERVETGSEELERNISNMEALRAAGELTDEDVALLDAMKKQYKGGLGKKYMAERVRAAAGNL